MTFDLTPIKNEVDEFLYNTQDVEITSSEQYNQAGDIVKAIKNKIKAIENKRVSYTKPLLDQKKMIDDDFKAAIKPLEELAKAIDSKMLGFYREEKKRRDEEQKKIEHEALEKAKTDNVCDVVVPVVNDIKTSRGDFSTNTVKMTWSFRIVDEEEVPREFMSIDERKIRAYVMANKEKSKVEGIEFYQEESLIHR